MQPVLKDGAVYFGDNGRAMCSKPSCAGMTATYSGRDLSGHKVSRVTVEDVAEWATYDIGPLACDCGQVALSTLAGPDGFPLAKATVSA